MAPKMTKTAKAATSEVKAKALVYLGVKTQIGDLESKAKTIRMELEDLTGLVGLDKNAEQPIVFEGALTIKRVWNEGQARITRQRLIEVLMKRGVPGDKAAKIADDAEEKKAYSYIDVVSAERGGGKVGE